MSSEKKYSLILGLLVFVWILVQVIQPKPTDWTESFSAYKKIPYGSFLLFEMLEESSDDMLSINTRPVYEQLGDSNRAPVNRIFLDRQFGPDPLEAELLLQAAERGDYIFIAARQFGQLLADTLNVETQSGNPILRGQSLFDDDTVSVHFTNPQLIKEGGYAYRQNTTESHFISADTLNTTILGVNGEGKANFILINKGEGAILLHSNPSLFTNYYLRETSGAEYAFKALSYFPEQPLVWDEYYKSFSEIDKSPLSYVVSEPDLRTAWYLILAGVLLFMVFKGRRRQRIIPEIKPPKNSTLEFTRTISSLYLEKGNHKLMAEKKIQYFLDYLRRHLGMDTSTLDDSFTERLAQRSGVDRQAIQNLLNRIQRVPDNENLSKDELRQLSQNIDHFYNQSQR